jgi:putative spermidine/putrescine transport system permease protein
MPLVATFEFSLRMRRGEYSFDAYRSVFADIQFRETFSYSILMAILTIIIGMLLIVPTAYWVRLRLPQMRPVVEFITLLPLVIPAIVIVFGYLRFTIHRPSCRSPAAIAVPTCCWSSPS